jgi:hypothetical protein
MRTSYVPIMHWEKMALTDLSSHQRAVSEFLLKEENLAGVIYEQLRGVYGYVCMGTSSVRRWVKHFKDGNTDINAQPRCERCILVDFSEKKKRGGGTINAGRYVQTLNKLRRALREKRHPSTCQRQASYCTSDLAEEKKRTAGNCSSIHLTVRILPPQTTTCSGPWKITRGHHYETDEAVQEAVGSWLRGIVTDFYRRGIFKILQCWEKCTDWDGGFVEKW